MKIAISVETNDGLESIIAHHFGRCPHFAVVNVDENEIQSVEVIDNPFYTGHQPGQVPKFIREQNADVMLSEGMGRRAIDIFQQFGIQTATGASGNVRSAIESYLNGELHGAAPCKDSVEHHEQGHHH